MHSPKPEHLDMTRKEALANCPLFQGPYPCASLSSGQAHSHGRAVEGIGVTQPSSHLRGTTAADVHAAMAAHYDGKQFVSAPEMHASDE